MGYKHARVVDFLLKFTYYYNMIKEYKIRIPELISRELIKENLIKAGYPQYSINEILIDKMIYVIYIIHRQIMKQGYRDESDFELAHLKSVYLKKTLGRSGKVTYKNVLDALSIAGIIEYNISYKVNYYSKSFGLKNRNTGKFTTEVLTHWVPPIKKEKTENAGSDELKAHYKENLKLVKVDKNYLALIIINEPSIEKNYYYIYFVEMLDSGEPSDLYAEIDPYGRLHHNLTGAAKILRPGFSLNGEKIFSIDLSASQLFFSIKGFEAYLKQIGNTKDIKVAFDKYPDAKVFIDKVLSGQFYSAINEYLKLSDEELKNNKRNILTPLFSKRDPLKKSKYFKAIETVFPAFSSFIKSLKKKSYENAAHVLQRAESKVMIEKVAMRLFRERKCWFLTVHDSILCLEKDIDYCKAVLLEECKKHTGHHPNIKTEQWTKDKLNLKKSFTENEWEELENNKKKERAILDVLRPKKLLQKRIIKKSKLKGS